VTQAAIGIDFGVTTTEVAVAVDDRTVVIEDSNGRSVIPSVVAFSPTGKELVGVAAKERRANDPANTIHSMKRILGESWNSSTVKHFVEQYPYFALERHEDGVPRFATRQGLMTAEEVSAKVIAHVRQLVVQAGHSANSAVVGVPSTFSRRQTAATIAALKRAGFKDAITVGEPIAIAWGITETTRKIPRKIAIYDLGGGTFNLAVCEVRGGGVGLLAQGGNEYLGGDDIDWLLADWLVEQVLRKYQWDIRTSPEAMARLLVECERAKISLSGQPSATIKLSAIEEADLLAAEEVTIERELLEDLATGLVRRTFEACDGVLAEAKVRTSDLGEIYLAGGSTQIPFIRRAVQRYFGRSPLISPRPDHLVAVGAALIALRCDLR
jgi:molecular chaperone DnaK